MFLKVEKRNLTNVIKETKHKVNNSNDGDDGESLLLSGRWKFFSFFFLKEASTFFAALILLSRGMRRYRRGSCFIHFLWGY